jgi:hypothetical protein
MSGFRAPPAGFPGMKRRPAAGMLHAGRDAMDARPFLLCLAAGLLGACGDRGPSGTPFACGSETCQPGYLCVSDYFYGFVPPETLSCTPFAADCLATPTCACLQGSPAKDDLGCDFTGCTEDAAGHVTVDCIAP